MGKKHKKANARHNRSVITTAQRHLLPLDTLDPASFERLCMWILQRSGFYDVAHYGDAGADDGRDVIARDADGRSWVLQAKRSQLGPTAAVRALEEAVAHQGVEGVIIASSHRLSAATRDALAAKAAELDVGILVWGRTEIDERAKASAEILREFFLKPTESLKKLITLEVSPVAWDRQDKWYKDPEPQLSTLYVPIDITNNSQMPVFVDRLILEAIIELPYDEEETYEFILAERFQVNASEGLSYRVSVEEIEARGCHVDAFFVARASVDGMMIKSEVNRWVMVTADVMTVLAAAPGQRISVDNDASMEAQIQHSAQALHVKRILDQLEKGKYATMTRDDNGEAYEVAIVPEWVRTRENASLLIPLELRARDLIEDALGKESISFKWEPKFTRVKYRGHTIAWMTASLTNSELLFYLKRLPADVPARNVVIEEIDPQAWWPGGFDTRFRVHIPDERALLDAVAVLGAMAKTADRSH